MNTGKPHRFSFSLEVCLESHVTYTTLANNTHASNYCSGISFTAMRFWDMSWIACVNRIVHKAVYRDVCLCAVPPWLNSKCDIPNVATKAHTYFCTYDNTPTILSSYLYYFNSSSVDSVLLQLLPRECRCTGVPEQTQITVLRLCNCVSTVMDWLQRFYSAKNT